MQRPVVGAGSRMAYVAVATDALSVVCRPGLALAGYPALIRRRDKMFEDLNKDLKKIREVTKLKDEELLFLYAVLAKNIFENSFKSDDARMFYKEMDLLGKIGDLIYLYTELTQKPDENMKKMWDRYNTLKETASKEFLNSGSLIGPEWFNPALLKKEYLTEAQKKELTEKDNAWLKRVEEIVKEVEEEK